MLSRYFILLLAASTFVFAQNYNSSVVTNGEPLTLTEMKVIKGSISNSSLESPVDKAVLTEAIERAISQEQIENDEEDDDEEDEDDQDEFMKMLEKTAKIDEPTEIIVPVTKVTPIFLKFQRQTPNVKMELQEPMQDRTMPASDGYVLPTEAEDVSDKIIDEYVQKNAQIRANKVFRDEKVNNTEPISNFDNNDNTTAVVWVVPSSRVAELREYLERNLLVSAMVIGFILAFLLLLVIFVIRWCRTQRRRKNTRLRLAEINAEMYETSSFSHRFEKVTLPENQEVTMQLMSADSSQMV